MSVLISRALAAVDDKVGPETVAGYVKNSLGSRMNENRRFFNERAT